MTRPAAGSARVVVAVVLVAASAASAYAIFGGKKDEAPRPRSTLTATAARGPASIPELGPLEEVRRSPAAAPAIGGPALDHVLEAVVFRGLPADLAAEPLALPALAALGNDASGRFVETTGTVASLDRERFSSDVDLRWDLLWSFALVGADGSKVAVVRPASSRDLDEGRPAPTRAGASPPPLADGDVVRVRGVVVRRVQGSVGRTSLDAPTVVLVAQKLRLHRPEKPPPASLDAIAWDAVDDRSMSATRQVADDAHWAALAWARERGAVAVAKDLVSGTLPVARWGLHEFARYGQELRTDVDQSAPDPRAFTRAARGKVWALTGWFAEYVPQDWESVPENPYGVDRRHLYWLMSDHYGNAVFPLWSAFPLATWEGVEKPRPQVRPRVRAYGVFVRSFSFVPSSGNVEITVPSFQLLHLELERAP